MKTPLEVIAKAIEDNEYNLLSPDDPQYEENYAGLKGIQEDWASDWGVHFADLVICRLRASGYVIRAAPVPYEEIEE